MRTEDEDRPPDCSTPLDAAVLADYWLALLTGAEEEAIEVHLLNCDGCGARLRELIALAQAVHNLARQGSLRIVVSEAFLSRAAAEGLRVREYAPPRGGAVQCTVTAEDDLLIARLAADLSGVKRVDLSICDEQGAEQLRLRDIPFRSAADGVIYQESITFAKALPTNIIMMRLLTFDDAGGEQLLGEYTFNHSRSIPGPPSG